MRQREVLMFATANLPKADPPRRRFAIIWANLRRDSKLDAGCSKFETGNNIKIKKEWCIRIIENPINPLNS